MRSRPTASPIIMRRSGLSVAQPKPLTKLAERELPDLRAVPVPGERRSAAEVTAISAEQAGQREAPVEPFGERPEEGAEQAHRQQAQHGDHGDEEGRVGLLVDDDADGHGLQPAHGRDDHADEPKPPEIPRERT